MATLFGTLKLSKNFDIDFIKLLFTKLRLGLKNLKSYIATLPPLVASGLIKSRSNQYSNNESCDDQSQFSMPSSVGE